MKTFENEKSQKNHRGILTKVLISQLVLVLGFLTWHRIKAKIIVFNMRPKCATLKQSLEERLVILYVCAFQFCHNFSFFSKAFIIIYEYSN